MLISSHIREKKGSSLGNTNIHLNLCPIILWIRNVCGINWQKLFAVFFFFFKCRCVLTRLHAGADTYPCRNSHLIYYNSGILTAGNLTFQRISVI